MTHLSSFGIEISGSIVLVFLFVLLLAAFSYYVYKHSIPKIPGSLKTLLMVLRAIIFILIALLIFEPVLSLTHKNIIASKPFLFIDNSNSIAVKDSVKRIEQTHTLINKLNDDFKTKIFSFGQEIDSIDIEHLQKIKFTEARTNFSSIIELIKQKAEIINSVVILSDGIITDGNDPTYQAEKLQVPIFTVGIGDSTQKKDIQIYNALYNQFIYAGKQTTIEAAIKNFGYGRKNTRISLFEENKLIESKDVVLNESGINKISFTYKPVKSGEKKLNVAVSQLEGESSVANNNRVFYLNVLDTRLKVCLIAGSPSADVAAISKALSTDKNIQVEKLIQISPNKFWNDVKASVLDSADILFLVDFPSSNSPQSLIRKVLSVIVDHNKPFFFLLSSGVSANWLKDFEKLLPFSFSKSTSEFIQVQPELIRETFSSYFANAGNQKEIWNNLPPVTQPATELTSKPGSNVLVKSKIKNIPTTTPLIVSRTLGRQRSFAILAGDIWRWKLQTAEKNPEFFNNFMNDIVKWLNASLQQKQFRITTAKKNYSPDEEVIFTAELYDQTFSPIDTAKITMEVSLNNKKFYLVFSPVGDGIYSSTFTPNEYGDYNFEGTAELNGTKVKSGAGRFNVGEIQIERLDTKMRVDFLKLFAESANGKYYSIENYDGLKEKLRALNKNSAKEKITKTEYQLWSSEWTLLIIALLFTGEWLIRKINGMV
ncbi:MAG: vWA domain-containing protein [Bacteroidota bacterium]